MKDKLKLVVCVLVISLFIGFTIGYCLNDVPLYSITDCNILVYDYSYSDEFCDVQRPYLNINYEYEESEADKIRGKK